MRSVAILSVVLSGGLLFLGAVTDAGLATALALSMVWAAYVTFLRSRSPQGPAITLARAALWGAVVWCLFQLIPLPLRVIGIVSPHAAETWQHTDLLLGPTSALHTLSIDPPATMFAATTALAVAITYEGCVRYAGHRDARFRLLRAVIVATMLLNVVALAHRAAGLERVYGIYAPRYPTMHGLLSPLLNPNHTAAVACIAPPLLVGIALGSPLSTRVFAGLGIIVSGAVAALSISRSGMLVFVLELGAMGIYAMTRAGKTSERLVRAATVFLALAGTVLGVALAASERVVAETRDTSTSKLRVPWQAFSLARDYLFAGVGRGAFGSAFPAYEGTLPANARYEYVENWPMQLLCDMGLLAAVAFVGALAASVYLTRERTRARPPYAGAVVALGGLVVHDLVDFSMEFAGPAMLAAVLLAVVTTTGSRTAKSETDRRRLPALAAAGGLIGALLLVLGWGHRADDEQRALQARRQSGELAPTIVAAAKLALARHPADPFFPGLIGVLQGFQPSSGAFFVRSIELGPNRGTTHFAFAKWLAAGGLKAQAFAELRTAMRLDPSMTGQVAAELVRMRADVEEILASIDTLPAGDVAVATLEKVQRLDDAEQVDAYLVDTFPPAVSARIRQIERLRRAKKLVEARALAANLRAVAPTSVQAWLVSASLAESDDEAEAILSQGMARAGKELPLVEALVRRRAIRLGLAAIPTDLAEYQLALERPAQPPFRFHAFKAEVESARGHPSAAIHYYLDAAAAAPESLEFLEKAAMLAESTGQTNMAQTLWSRLSAMRPEDPRYREKAQAPKAAASTAPSSP